MLKFTWPAVFQATLETGSWFRLYVIMCIKERKKTKRLWLWFSRKPKKGGTEGKRKKKKKTNTLLATTKSKVQPHL